MFLLFLELAKLREQAEGVIAQVAQEEGVELEIKIGTMIELPRAAVTADEIATKADFFSFGTNDLTQTTFGFSRDDVEAELSISISLSEFCHTTRLLRLILALLSSLRWVLSSVIRATPTSSVAFAVSTVAILTLSRLSTVLGSTTSAALPIACLWLVLLLHMLLLQISNCFEITICHLEGALRGSFFFDAKVCLSWRSL